MVMWYSYDVSCVPEGEGGWQPLICLCVQVAGVLSRLLAERSMWPFESSLFTEACEGEPWVPIAHMH